MARHCCDPLLGLPVDAQTHSLSSVHGNAFLPAWVSLSLSLSFILLVLSRLTGGVVTELLPAAATAATITACLNTGAGAAAAAGIAD